MNICDESGNTPTTISEGALNVTLPPYIQELYDSLTDEQKAIYNSWDSRISALGVLRAASVLKTRGAGGR